MSQKQQSQQNRTLIDYCDRFAELKVRSTKQRGDAPHQPILLLSVIDLIAQGKIQENKIEVSEQLEDTFHRYWNILKNHKSDRGLNNYIPGLHNPFIALENSHFWCVKYNEEEKQRLQEQINNRPKPKYRNRKPQAKSFEQLQKLVEYAYLDEKLFELLQNEESRKQIVDTLISVWFSISNNELKDVLEINLSFEDKSNTEENKVPKTKLTKSLVRDAFFRKAVVYIYDYKCAFCGLNVNRSLTQTIVDGAHIKPFAQFYDSKIDNGISFCKNHHWAFDRGWFAINDDYKIIVANDLHEYSPNAKPITAFNGETIILPNLEQYYPRLEALKWHRQNIFRLK
jgi:putative restriction endonuclease